MPRACIALRLRARLCRFATATTEGVVNGAAGVEERKVRRLTAGERWIRTFGPPQIRSRIRATSWPPMTAGRSRFRNRELKVRIHLPPADSPSLSRSHFRASRTRAFPAGVRGSLDDGVSRDAAGFPLRANRRQCLCRAIFQYRSAADAVSGNATTVRTKSGVSGL
jgi:hypothetical protein